jgi:hypothetical protein
LFTRSLAPALASLFFAASVFAQTAPAVNRWMTLADALPAAQAKQSLILLDFHSSERVGLKA